MFEYALFQVNASDIYHITFKFMHLQAQNKRMQQKDFITR